MALVKAVEPDFADMLPDERRKRLGRHLSCYNKDFKEDPTRNIDYQTLNWLVNLDGLHDELNDESSPEAHAAFMRNYHLMFTPETSKAGRRQNMKHENRELSTRSTLVSTSKSNADGNETRNRFHKSNKRPESDSYFTSTHNIRDYTALLHRQRNLLDPVVVHAHRIKTLRRLLKKMPFERSAAENDTIYKVLKAFPSFTDQVSDKVLKELCMVAQLDVWKQENLTVFGNSGFHMLLKGSVKALSNKHVKMLDDSIIGITSPRPFNDEEAEDKWKKSLVKLKPGDCFGTLKKLENRKPNSRILSVVTDDDHCEFLKISTSEYAKTKEQIETRDQTEKVNLLQSCKNYKLWSRQPLHKVASLVEWKEFPANSVIVNEGYESPFIGFIKSGECHVLRQVDTIQTLKNGKKERSIKQVVMGKLKQSESFGEISILNKEAVTCSIVSATAVEMGIIEPKQLANLDDVTKQLLRQSSERTFGNLSEDDIHEEYMKQELKREWNEYKHSVVLDVINHKGVKPGQGKWGK